MQHKINGAVALFAAAPSLYDKTISFVTFFGMNYLPIKAVIYSLAGLLCNVCDELLRSVFIDAQLNPDKAKIYVLYGYLSEII